MSRNSNNDVGTVGAVDGDGMSVMSVMTMPPEKKSGSNNNTPQPQPQTKFHHRHHHHHQDDDRHHQISSSSNEQKGEDDDQTSPAARNSNDDITDDAVIVENVDLGYLMAPLSRHTIEMLVVQLMDKHPEEYDLLLKAAHAPVGTADLVNELTTLLSVDVGNFADILVFMETTTTRVRDYITADIPLNALAIVDAITGHLVQYCQDCYVKGWLGGEESQKVDALWASLETAWQEALQAIHGCSKLSVTQKSKVIGDAHRSLQQWRTMLTDGFGPIFSDCIRKAHQWLQQAGTIIHTTTPGVGAAAAASSSSAAAAAAAAAALSPPSPARPPRRPTRNLSTTSIPPEVDEEIAAALGKRAVSPADSSKPEVSPPPTKQQRRNNMPKQLK